MKTAYFEKGSFLVVPNKEVVFKLRGAQLNVYLVIIDHANDKGECWPSYNRLIDITGYKRRQCIDAVKHLEEVGLIKKRGQARNDGGQTSNRYQLMVIHNEGAVERTPPSEPKRTPWGAVERTPELNPLNSTYKELKGRGSNKFDKQQKRSYALACRADEAQALRASAARSRKGSTSHLGEIFATRV